MTTFLSNREIYTSVVCGIVPQARERLWIATADIKDMYVDAGGREMVPFLEVLDGMVKRGVEVRLIHAKDPGPNCGANAGRGNLTLGIVKKQPLSAPWNRVKTAIVSPLES